MWLFLTAHRLGDMRRLVRQYGRAIDTVYPTGNYSSNGRTGVYGNDTSFPIPIEEQNNPEYPTDNGATKGCVSLDP
jgi:starch-binding outer membrane protein, SusD/RagB family